MIVNDIDKPIAERIAERRKKRDSKEHNDKRHPYYLDYGAK